MTILGPFAHSSVSCKEILSLEVKSSFFVRKPEKIDSVMQRISSKGEAELFIDQLHSSILKKRVSFRIGHIRSFERNIQKWSNSVSLNHLIKIVSIVNKGGVFHLSETFLKLLEGVVLTRIDEFRVNQAVEVLSLLGKVKTRPSDKVLKVLSELLVDRLDELSYRRLGLILAGYADLGLTPPRAYLRVWYGRLRSIGDEIGPARISVVIFSLYLMREFELLREYIGLIPVEKWELFVKPSHRRILSLVEQYMRTVLMRKVTELNGFKGDFKRLATPNDYESKLETAAALVFKNEGLNFAQEFQTIPGFFVDFYFESENKVVQIDGPHHYIVSYRDGIKSLKLRLQDTLNDEVLKRHGYKVERMNSSDIKARESEEENSHINAPGFIGLFGRFKPEN